MQNRLEQAIAATADLIEVRPTAEAHTFLGWVYSFQGGHADAIAECKFGPSRSTPISATRTTTSVST